MSDLAISLSDRRPYCELRQHGISTSLAIGLGLAFSSRRDRDDAELSLLSEAHLRIHDDADGTRVWDIVPAADATYSLQVPLTTPARIDLDGNGGLVPLCLGSVYVEARVLSEHGL